MTNENFNFDMRVSRVKSSSLLFFIHRMIQGQVAIFPPSYIGTMPSFSSYFLQNSVCFTGGRCLVLPGQPAVQRLSIIHRQITKQLKSRKRFASGHYCLFIHRWITLNVLHRLNSAKIILFIFLQILVEDLFGEVATEREVEKIANKIPEAKTCKSFDTFEILGKFVGTQSLTVLVSPLKEVCLS